MYHHNFIYCDRLIDKAAILQLEEGIKNLLANEFINLNVSPRVEISKDQVQKFLEQGAEQSNLLYMYLSLNGQQLEEDELNCKVIRAHTPEQIKDGVICLEEIDSLAISPGFAKRKAARKHIVYQDGRLKVYIAYEDEKPIGICEWFQTENIVRIEDFSIREEFQRKGYGTAMFKKMRSDAILHGAEFMFLTTYLDETPQHMYRKWGFKDAGIQGQFLWKGK